MYALLAALLLDAAAPPMVVWEGDVLFQDDPAGSWQKTAEGSAFSTVGLVIQRQGQLVVIEARGRVVATPVADFLARGPTTLRRPATPLTDDEKVRLRGVSQSMMARHADTRPDWSDSRFYGPELVWKTYKKVGRPLGPLGRLGEPRYDAIRGELPPTMPVVSIGAVLDSPVFLAPPSL